ncbi:MAG: DNA primase DnaG [Candidatus Bathyarchaeota archaeon]|nr:DNA primase DnaG [Candidatus Bathyarchaeota archaeon]
MDESKPVTAKYHIKVKFEVDGIVEKSDVIGAVFGQTEGLFGADLDLRELQKTGRIGRIEIDMESSRNKTQGTIVIPSSLNRTSTALIAAAIESVDRVGPCAARTTLEKIEDEREKKRSFIIARASAILKGWNIESLSSTDKILKQISKAVKPAEITSFGPEGLPAGPAVPASESIIIVEGRADVAKLLKSGINNIIASEGAKVPESIIELSKQKEVTAFLDGDRGGDILLKELLQVADIDYVARAPRKKEVEELMPEEILEALRKRIPVEELKKRIKRRPAKKKVEDMARARTVQQQRAVAVPSAIFDAMSSLKGTLEAVILDENMKTIARTPVSDLYEKVKEIDRAETVLFDGVITQRLVNIASDKGVKRIIGGRISDVVKRPIGIQLLTPANLAKKED